MSDVEAGVVYIIGTPGSSTVKIGRTIDLVKRLADIQRMSPVPLEVLWSTPGGHELETHLHRHFKQFRSHGEWFTFRSAPAPLIQRAVADQPWLRPKVTLKKRKTRPKVPSQPVPPKAAARPNPAGEREWANLASARGHLLETVTQVEDPLERYRSTERVGAALREIFREQYQAIALELKSQGLTWRQVGERLGVTGARAEQISRASR